MQTGEEEEEDEQNSLMLQILNLFWYLEETLMSHKLITLAFFFLSFFL